MTTMNEERALAEKLRTDAIAIFGEGHAERYIIEWFYDALLAAAPATPAAQADDRDALLSEARMVLSACVSEGELPSEIAWMAERASKGRRIYTDDVRLPAAQGQGEVQRLREALERATKLLSAAAGYATKMEPMPAKLLNAIDTALAASTGQEVKK